MEDFKKSYLSYLDKFKNRQTELGLTNIEMANWIGVKPSNYERLLNGAYPMSVPRFEQICNVLGFGFCLIDKEMLDTFNQCVEEEFADFDVVDGK